MSACAWQLWAASTPFHSGFMMVAEGEQQVALIPKPARPRAAESDAR